LNAKHAEFADSLYIAERNARKALEEKAQLRKEVALQQKEQREIELRELARQAKEQRNGLVQQESASSESEVSEDEIEEREQRDQLREEMKRERRRDYRMSQRGTKRSKRERELERDISERVALGQGPPPMAAKGDAVFDHRLFNKEKGIGVGFGADDCKSIHFCLIS
jgi:SNW domain-containing protein 1